MSTEERVVEMRFICTMEFYSAAKTNEIMKNPGKWMDLKNVILSEVTPAPKDKLPILSVICGSQLQVWIRVLM